jgi:SAM-dependent methyltransferase
MTDKFAAIADLLSCPDDGGFIRHTAGEFLCSSCTRRFPIFAGNLAEILPRRPWDVAAFANPAYQKSYLRAFEEAYRYDENSRAWGAEESAQESWSRKRFRQVAAVEPLITQGTTPGESILCDIAAGAGYYTFAYAPRFRFVLHCDLSVDNLNYAYQKARTQGIQNIFFLRSDYFAPPFRQSLDRIICLDTLIRGEAHDSVLLAVINRSLTPSGRAVVDFHNWWHNPLRRVGLLRENFAENRSYAARELPELLAAAGIDDFDIQPFIQELNADGWSPSILKWIIPPTRFLVRLKSHALRERSEAFERAGSA